MAKVSKSKTSTVCRNCSFQRICQGKYLDKDRKCMVALTPVSLLPDRERVGFEVCPVCTGRERVFHSGSWEQCVCLVLRKVRAYLAPLAAYGGIGGSLTTTTTKDIIKTINERKECQNLLIQAMCPTPSAVVDIFAFLLLRGGIKRSYFSCSLRDLTMAALNDPGSEEFNVKRINHHDVLLLTVGLHEEMPNKLYPNVLLEVIRLRQWSNRQLYIFCKGKLSTAYPVAAQELDAVEINLEGTATSTNSPPWGTSQQTVLGNIRRNEDNI